jgi:hypothetical protein
MKAILLATAMSLAVTGAAMAQDATSPAAQQPSNGQTPGDTSGAPASSMGDTGTSTAAPSTPDTGTSGGTPMPADSSGSAGGPTSGPTGMGAPADGSSSMGGSSMGSSSTGSGMSSPTASTGDYPACSKGVTDKCVEKGGMKKMKKRR